MSTVTYNIEVKFTTPYVAHPYWPEMYQVIEIQKKSGINRAKSDANRRKALDEYLRANNMTLAEYEELVTLSKRPFHVAPSGNIIIPEDSVAAFFVASNSVARAAFRACPPEQVRSRLMVSAWVTDKTAPDGVWKRFATVNLGSGAKASNQRALRENAFIADFTARGKISFDPHFVKPDAVKNNLEFGGDVVGIGASRKMGKGRFKMVDFTAIK